MERCECLPLNSKFARKSVFVNTKLFNRQTFQLLINNVQSYDHWHEHSVLSLGCHWSMALSMTLLELSPDYGQIRQKLTTASDRPLLSVVTVISEFQIWIQSEIPVVNRILRDKKGLNVTPSFCPLIIIKTHFENRSLFEKVCYEVMYTKTNLLVKSRRSSARR